MATHSPHCLPIFRESPPYKVDLLSHLEAENTINLPSVVSSAANVWAHDLEPANQTPIPVLDGIPWRNCAGPLLQARGSITQVPEAAETALEMIPMVHWWSTLYVLNPHPIAVIHSQDQLCHMTWGIAPSSIAAKCFPSCPQNSVSIQHPWILTPTHNITQYSYTLSHNTRWTLLSWFSQYLSF